MLFRQLGALGRASADLCFKKTVGLAAVAAQSFFSAFASRSSSKPGSVLFPASQV